jgi:hypothetical protein
MLMLNVAYAWWRMALGRVMMWCVERRARLRTLSFWLNLVLFLVSVYLAVAVVLSDHDVPTDNAWKPWRPLFLSLVAGGIYVAGFAFYEYLRAQRAADRVRVTDGSIMCQKIACRIISGCRQLDPAELAVGVWLTKKDGTFDRRMRFLLPASRPLSPILWHRGVGVVGSLWASDDEPDCLEKLTLRNEMNAISFGQLPEADRLGLSHAQWQSVKGYTGVVAVKLVGDAGGSKKLLGFLVIDYRGALTPDADGRDVLDSVDQAMRDKSVSELRGGLVDLLRERV